MSCQAIYHTQLEGLPTPRRGKVRDIYDLGDRLLIVASDRISAYDVIMPQPVPDKGAVLTQTSLFWFEHMADLVPNHLLPDLDWTGIAPQDRQLVARQAMYVRKAQPMPIECIVRGYLAGSGWKEYQRQGSVCGIPLPPGLEQSARLPEPLFTPSTKAEVGHDENITFEQGCQLVDRKVMEQLRDLSLAIYTRAHALAAERGFILCDTKFEFGLHDGRLILIDEVLTPDSSRYWLSSDWAPGSNPYAYDKQYLRDWLDSTGWDHNPPAPDLPEDVIANVRKRYIEAFQRLTGRSLPPAPTG